MGDMDSIECRPEVLVASILYLLSSSAINGMSHAKSEALLLHLSGLIEQKNLDPLLHQSCQELFNIWQSQVYEAGHFAHTQDGTLH